MSIKNLGYLVVQSTDFSKWEDYGLNVLGMMKSTSMADNGTMYLKMDQRPFRYQIVEGAFDGLLYCGWDMGNEADFNATLEKLSAKGTAFEKIEDAAVLAGRA
ncbi:MAG: biphenyl 2,3-dioxygenase, partial [Pseudomonadales bacterium]|nr:biphenyl 2,3-dioxygenase [Pseudomonadales bacterium]